MPGLVPPADIPHDAEGRIAFVTVVVPEAASATDPAVAARDPEPSDATTPGRVGWTAVALLAVVVIVAFVVGMAATR